LPAGLDEETVVCPILGGLLHVHIFAADTKSGSTLEFSGAAVANQALLFHQQLNPGIGNERTIQFPPMELNGFGSALPTEYGPKHIAIPNFNVSVGARYNLNCDMYVHHGVPR